MTIDYAIKINTKLLYNIYFIYMFFFTVFFITGLNLTY